MFDEKEEVSDVSELKEKRFNVDMSITTGLPKLFESIETKK
jgi:hypothetical protein